MKKVAFIVRLLQDDFFYGGGEKFIYKLVSEFVKNNYIVDIWCNESAITSFPGINEIILCDDNADLSNPVAIEAYYDKLRASMAEKQYDYVINDGISPVIDLLLLQIHSLVHKRFNKNNFLQYFYYKKFKPTKIQNVIYEEKWAKQDHRKIFVVSDKIKQDLIKDFNVAEEKISVIYPGVDPVEQIEIPKTNDIFTFGISATFFKRKGGILFLDALRRLKLKGYKFKAIMILRSTASSKTRWLKIMLKIFNISNEVEFVSYQNPMSEFYKKLDGLVMPSVEEAFGLVTLEAMLNRVPCIVSSCGGVSEVIKDGYDGFVFNIKNNPSRNLAKKMIEVMNNPETVQNCIINGLETAKKYNWNKTFTDLESNLQSLDIKKVK